MDNRVREEDRSIYKIGFECEDDLKIKRCYITVSIPESIVEDVCQDGNIGYYFDAFNDVICEKYRVSISDYLVEDIIDLGLNYEGKIDLVLNKDEEGEDEKSSEEYTTICINPFLKKNRIKRTDLESN